LIKKINIGRDADDPSTPNPSSRSPVTARFNRLPASGYLWRLIALLSLWRILSKFYEIALTALSRGLIRAGGSTAMRTAVRAINTNQAILRAATVPRTVHRNLVVLQPLPIDSAAARFLIGCACLVQNRRNRGEWRRRTRPRRGLVRFIAGAASAYSWSRIDSYIAEWVPEDRRGKGVRINYGLMYLAFR